MKASKRRKQHKKRLRWYLAAILTGGLMMALATLWAYADVATDYLTVKVGYSGMELSEYVEAGKYHWRDLRDALELHKEAYSYFQRSSKTKYTAIVDSAQGFYIRDILELAHIYYGDVRSLKFYVEDSKGIRTSFDRDALFGQRYYYEDVAGNRTVVYGTKTVTEEKTETIHHEAEYKTETYTETVHHDPEYETETYTETIHHDPEYETETYTEEVDGEEVEKEREVLVKEAWDEEIEKEREVLVKEAWDEEVEKEREVLVKEAWDEEVTTTEEKEVEDKSKVVEYKFDNASRHAVQVQPMLAIEDNWAQFSEEFEHIGPDFSSMNAGNRFRLLFGQTSPTESLTSMSDKYVSCIYVMLDGRAEVGEMGELNGKRGSHTVELTVSADNGDIKDALSELLNIDSSNTDVLVVKDVQVTPDSTYSDLVRVTVSYDIVGDGEASLTIGVGSGEGSAVASKSVVGGSGGEEPANPGEDAGGTDPERKEDEDGAGGEKEDPADDDGSGDGAGHPSGHKDSDAGEKDSAGDQDGGNVPANPSEAEKNNQKTKELTDQKELKSEKPGGVVVYELSEEAAARLMAASRQQPEVQATENIEEVTVEDTEEDHKKNERRLLALTGLGLLLTGALGGAAEMLSFSMRLEGRVSLR